MQTLIRLTARTRPGRRVANSASRCGPSVEPRPEGSGVLDTERFDEKNDISGSLQAREAEGRRSGPALLGFPSYIAGGRFAVRVVAGFLSCVVLPPSWPTVAEGCRVRAGEIARLVAGVRSTAQTCARRPCR